MSIFTVRVELHDANWQDYDNLHKRMAAAGFHRTITADSGTKYHLPTAEYDIDGNYTRQGVLDAACRAADGTGKRSSVLVTEAFARTWRGLAPVVPTTPAYR